MDKKNYYAIIPAPVRYDTSLTANAKLMFGELTALSSDQGFCFASNGYFADLYNVSNETISRWIKSLKVKNHIRIEYDRRGAEVTQRRIFISHFAIDKKINRRQKDQPSNDKKINRTVDKKIKENNTSINNIVLINTIGKKQCELIDKIYQDFSTEDAINKLLIEWLTYRHEIKKPYKTLRGLKAIISKIKSKSIQEVKQAIKKAFENEWQSFHFENTSRKPKSNALKNFDDDYE